ncbi:MAG: N-acetylmuramoyl-L-alanine amidase [Actinomycetota bacterium]|nr:N-acetylmuramoyl-L-alanine amidase [Actinomycetota bacterium]
MAAAVAGGGALLVPGAAGAAVPEGTDFEQVLPTLERLEHRSADSAEGPVTHRSPVVDAPESFDMAGLRGETREYELRGRVAGAEWTDWTETLYGDPVWFGGMDQLQVRTRGWRPEGKVHYVAVTEPASAPIAARGSGSGIPEIITRKQWGAKQDSGGCEPRRTPDYGRVKAAGVHHTVSAVNYSESQAPGMVLAICRYHRNSNGWNDIGYNALVDRFGNIYAGRDGGLGRAVVGAQMQGYNAQTTGVAVIGTHTSTPISRRAMSGLTRWLAWKLPEHGHDTTGTARMISAGGDLNRFPAGTRVNTNRIIGHRRTGYTECPGDALVKQLGKLREKVQRRIDR